MFKWHIHLTNFILFFIDVDECAASTDGCEFSCTNTDGGYTCGCPTGYSLAGDQRNCIGKYVKKTYLICDSCIPDICCYTGNGVVLFTERAYTLSTKKEEKINFYPTIIENNNHCYFHIYIELNYLHVVFMMNQIKLKINVQV